MAHIKPKTSIKFEKPSSWWGALWREGLPLGNGLSGACVYGGAAKETVMLTSALSSWQGNISVLPDISDKLKEVRSLIDDGKYSQAESVYTNALINKNYRPQPSVPLPVCDLKIDMNLSKTVKDYSRALNMESGEVLVAYKEGATKFERATFVSRAEDLIVCEITKSGADTINADFCFDMHDRKNALTPQGIYSRLPEAVMTKYEPYFMYFSARKDNGTEFGAVARISYYGGSMEAKHNKISVKGANSILIIIKLFTESQREKEWTKLKAQLAAIKYSYDKMLKEHSKIHSKLFLSAELDLNAENRDYYCDDMLKSAYNQNADEALIEKLWQYGRYLFICSTKAEGSLTINPYGLWCGDYKAPDSYTSYDGAAQNLYRFAFENNLGDMVLPLFNYLEGVLQDLKKNAQRLYNCKGIFIPAVTNGITGLPGSTDAKDVYFVAATADIACMFYDYYLISGDKKFLKERAMPFMKEAQEFYSDFLRTGEEGYFISYPSYSPDGCPANLYDAETDKSIHIAKNSEIDFAVVKKLLTYLLEGTDICGLYKEEKVKWQDMLKKIPPAKISPANFVYEYNTAEFAENFRKGGIGTLYGVYPCGFINTLSEDSKKAYLNTVKRRITEGLSTLKSHTIAYLCTVCARLGDGGGAAELINHILKSCVTGNLITAENDYRGMGFTDDAHWATFNITGNTLLNAAITSMLIYSDSNNLFVMPCGEVYKSGSIKGITTLCGCETDMVWNAKTIRLSLKAKKTCSFNIVLPQMCRKILKGPVAEFDENGIIKGVEIIGGKTAIFEIKV